MKQQWILWNQRKCLPEVGNRQLANRNTIDLATGLPGPLRPLEGMPGLHVEDLHYFDRTLYATTRDSGLLTIDPVTAAVTVVPVPLDRVRAIARYEP